MSRWTRQVEPFRDDLIGIEREFGDKIVFKRNEKEYLEI